MNLMNGDEWAPVDALVTEVRVPRAVWNELVDEANWAPKLDKLMVKALAGLSTSGPVAREIFDEVTKAHFDFAAARNGDTTWPRYFTFTEVLDFLDRQRRRWKIDQEAAPADPFPKYAVATLHAAMLNWEHESKKL